MAEVSYNLPTKGEARSSSDGKIREALSSIKEQINGKIEAVNLAASTVTDAKLASPNNSVYKTLLTGGAYIGAKGVGTYYLSAEGGVRATGAATTEPPPLLFQFAKADYEVGSKSQKLRIRSQVTVGSTSPSTVKVNVKLFPLTISAGTYALGTAVTSSSANSSGLATNTISSFTSESGDFAFPSDGVYCLGVVVESITVPSGIAVSAQLQTRNV